MSISVPIADDPVPQFLEREGLHLVAGIGVFTAIMVEINKRCPKTPEGKYRAAPLATLHAQHCVRGFVGAEVYKAPHGYVLRYDSGLQNFDPITRADTLPAMLDVARRWAAADPMFRYVWMWDDAT